MKQMQITVVSLRVINRMNTRSHDLVDILMLYYVNDCLFDNGIDM